MAQNGIGELSSKSQTAPKKEEPKWTVMVFMGADSLPGDADLSKEADDDIDEMRRVGSLQSRVNIFVQLHRKGTVERRHIKKSDPGAKSADDELMEVPDSDRDPTNGTALIAFIKAALVAAKHTKQDHTMLVLWGHAYRFGIGPQNTPHGVDALDFAELATVLRKFQDELRPYYQFGSNETPRLDIVGFDACDLASIEMAYQLYQFADYLVASQIGIPLPGWPYDKVLKRLRCPKGRLMGPAELGSYIARRYGSTYAAMDRAVSLSVLDLKWAPKLFDLAEALARRLALAVAADEDELQRIYELFLRSRTPDNRPFVDVADLCFNLARYSLSNEVVKAATALGDVLISPNPQADDAEGGGATGAGKPFIVENVRNRAETAGLHGVSLYAPHVADTHDSEGATHFYEKFLFAQRTLWSELVHALTLPD